jgi:hypothetical protein
MRDEKLALFITHCEIIRAAIGETLNLSVLEKMTADEMSGHFKMFL